MRNKQIQLLYGISGIQIAGIGFMIAGQMAGSVLNIVGTIALVVYATGILIEERKVKVCPKCKADIPKKDRICPECGHRYKEGISEDKLTEYIEQEKEKEQTSEKIDHDFEQIESVTVDEMTAYDGDIEDFLKNRYKESDM